MSIKDWFRKNGARDNDDELEDYDDFYYGGEDTKSRDSKNDRDDSRERDDRYESDDDSYSPRRSTHSAERDGDGDDDGYYSSARHVKKAPKQETYEEPEYTGARNDDVDYDYYSPVFTRPAEPAPAPVSEPDSEPVPTAESVPETEAPVNAGTLYFQPETYTEDREEIVVSLCQGHVVVINMSRLNRTSLVRLVDFISGAVLALDADMFRLDGTTLVLSPVGVEVDPSEIEFPDSGDDTSDIDTDGETEEDGDSDN